MLKQEKHMTDNPTKNFLTPNQLAEKYPAFPIGGIRWNLFHAEKNGLAKCVRRIGRKVLIEENLFLNWVDAQKGGA